MVRAERQVESPGGQDSLLGGPDGPFSQDCLDGPDGPGRGATFLTNRAEQNVATIKAATEPNFSGVVLYLLYVYIINSENLNFNLST